MYRLAHLFETIDFIVLYENHIKSSNSVKLAKRYDTTCTVKDLLFDVIFCDNR